MKVKICKTEFLAEMPRYATDGSAGMDLTAVSCKVDSVGNYVYGTGLSFAIPKGYVGLLFPRSSNTKKDLLMGNSVGVLDSDYRGEVTFKFRPISVLGRIRAKILRFLGFEDGYGMGNGSCTPMYGRYRVGERIGQLVVVKIPRVEFVEMAELDETERGTGGYGSTGV